MLFREENGILCNIFGQKRADLRERYSSFRIGDSEVLHHKKNSPLNAAGSHSVLSGKSIFRHFHSPLRRHMLA